MASVASSIFVVQDILSAICSYLLAREVSLMSWAIAAHNKDYYINIIEINYFTYK